MEYIISFIIVLIFAIWELYEFNKVRKLIALYKNIFPNDTDQIEFNRYTLRSNYSAVVK